MNPTNARKHWTDSDINMLIEMNDRGCKRALMSDALQRSEQAISNKLHDLKMQKIRDEMEEECQTKPNEWLRQTGAEEEQIEIDIVPPADSYVVNEPVDKLGEIERMPLDNICDKIDALTEYVGGVNSKLVTMTIGMVALLVLFIVAFAY